MAREKNNTPPAAPAEPPAPPKLVTITIKEKKQDQTFQVPVGTIMHDFFQSTYPRPGGNPIVGAKVNFVQFDLWHKVTEDCLVEPIDLTSHSGSRIFERSLVLLLLRALEDLYPNSNARLEVRHSISRGIFCEVSGVKIQHDVVEKLQNYMRKLVVNNEPFKRTEVSLKDAIALFEQHNMPDKARLLQRHPTEKVTIYRCGNTVGSSYGRIVPEASYLRNFALEYYPPGLILRFPDKESPDTVPTFEEQHRLFRVFQEYKRWAEVQEVNDIGELNQKISDGRISDLIRVAEAIQEKKIAQIADSIHQDQQNIRVILIAGPSSSGKTTFAKRLSVQLKVQGITTIPISLDDYFRARAELARDENGKQDLESIDAVDTPLLNEHLQSLADGHEVMMPIYDFKIGGRKEERHPLRIKPGEILILEGIHGLNPKLTAQITELQKFKIYISPLTVLNIDSHNRIPTTDLRLIRRIVRDAKFRGYSASQTIGQWPSVRRGDFYNIFPYQNRGDVMFNSALIYELAALKPYAMPLLQNVPEKTPEYSEAQRLLIFLSYFNELSPERIKEIPPTSILREFIGDSSFKY